MIEAERDGVARTADWLEQETSQASGGAYVVSTAPGSSLSIYFSGTAVTVEYVSGPAFGAFDIVVDGAVVQTVNSYAEAFVFGQQVSLSGLAAGVHELTILPQGTSGIDAFLFGEATAEPTATPTASATAIATPEATTEATAEATEAASATPTVETTEIATEAASATPTGNGARPQRRRQKHPLKRPRNRRARRQRRAPRH